MNPIVLSTLGANYRKACRILAIIWEGATTANDTAVLSDPVTGSLIWPVRTSATATYLGISFGQRGFEAPNGFVLSQISAGSVCVYLDKG